MSNRVGTTNRDARAKGGVHAEHEKLLLTIDERLRGDARWILDWARKEAQHNLLDRYELGQRVKSIHDFKTDGGTDAYGKNAIADICKHLQRSSTELYETKRYYEQYTREEVKKLSTTVFPNGRYFTWNHARMLFPVKNGEQRKALIEQVVTNGWSSTELEKKVKASLDTQNRGGASVNKSKDFDGGVKLVRGNTQKWLDDIKNVGSTPNNSLVSKAKRLPTDAITEERLNLLRKAKEEIAQLVTEAKKRIQDVDQAIKVLEGHRKK